MNRETTAQIYFYCPKCQYLGQEIQLETLATICYDIEVNKIDNLARHKPYASLGEVAITANDILNAHNNVDKLQLIHNGIEAYNIVIKCPKCGAVLGQLESEDDSLENLLICKYPNKEVTFGDLYASLSNAEKKAIVKILQEV